jgi:hypothetical protein
VRVAVRGFGRRCSARRRSQKRGNALIHCSRRDLDSWLRAARGPRSALLLFGIVAPFVVIPHANVIWAVDGLGISGGFTSPPPVAMPCGGPRAADHCRLVFEKQRWAAVRPARCAACLCPRVALRGPSVAVGADPIRAPWLRHRPCPPLCTCGPSLLGPGIVKHAGTIPNDRRAEPQLGMLSSRLLAQSPKSE